MTQAAPAPAQRNRAQLTALLNAILCEAEQIKSRLRLPEERWLYRGRQLRLEELREQFRAARSELNLLRKQRRDADGCKTR